MRQNKGFTLVELLIVVGIIAFLAAAILVAVDPVKRIQDAHNAQRWTDVNNILNAVLKRQVDDRALFNGNAAAPIITNTTNAQVIVSDDAGIDCTASGTRPGCNKALDVAAAKTCIANLNDLIPNYIAEIPVDPASNKCGTGVSPGCVTTGDIAIGKVNSGYYIHRSTGNRIEIGACQPEQGATINVKR